MLPNSEDASRSVAASSSSAGDEDKDNVDTESPAGGPAAEPAVGDEGGGAMPDAGEVGGMDDAAKKEATKPAADGATPGYAS